MTNTISEPGGQALGAEESRPLAETVLEILSHLLPPDRPLALHEPRFAGREWDLLKDCLDSTYVSSVGAYVDQFETALAGFVGVRHAVATVNGTAALHIALRLAGVDRDDEVLLPSLTFVATANAVAYQGAVPHFVESTERTLGVDVAALADHLADIAESSGNAWRNRLTGRRLSAIVPVHVFGHPVDMDALTEIGARYRLSIIEDATESLGSRYKGRMTGAHGRMAALSFNGNKIVTTGGGGAILTDDDELARAAKHLTTTAKQPHRWAFMHDEIGYNYRMPNLNAALGCAQLEQLPDILACKRALADRYRDAFAGVPGLAIVSSPPDSESNYWLNALLLQESYSDQRDPILSLTNDAGILTRPAWTPLHRLPMYDRCPRMDLSATESLERRLVSLPSSAVLGSRDVAS